MCRHNLEDLVSKHFIPGRTPDRAAAVPRDGSSRRAFLTAAGVGAAGLVAASPARAAAAPSGPVLLDGPDKNFSRMFPALPPFAPNTEQVRAALIDIGRPGGIMDAADDLSAGPIRLITDPSLSLVNRDNPTHTAGTTFMGQFMDHDMTFDLSSELGVTTSPTISPNERVPLFDLDSVYGGGPVKSPALYDPDDRATFLVESGGQFEDVPRMSSGAALIADFRNDEHLIISGLHAAFLLFHNRVVDFLRLGAVPPVADVFPVARKLVTWHYQWMILHEFLPLFVGQERVDDILSRGRRFYRPDNAAMPVEFQTGSYRFGHSMVRPSYRANLAGDAGGEPFFGFIFDPAAGGPDPADLRGGARAPRRFVGWQTFFDFGDRQVRPNKRIDTKISTALFHLPLPAIPAGTPPTALPQRNLLRHLTWSLPSGQAVANAMGETALGPSEFTELASYGLGLDRSTPLWFYVLKEAEVTQNGLRLGPVGGTIVAEVIIGLLQKDPDSFLTQNPLWVPTLPSREPAGFRMVDLLRFAKVDPASRGQ